MFSMAKGQMHSRLVVILLVFAAFGLGFHAVADAVCAQSETFGLRGCSTTPTTTLTALGQIGACAVLHNSYSGIDLPNIIVPSVFVFTAAIVAIRLVFPLFTPPAQPPKYCQTI